LGAFEESSVIVLIALFACTDKPDDTAADVAEPINTDRVVLHEAFSGSNCGPCAPAAENLAAALAGAEGRYAMVKYQIGSDPYISNEAVRRRMFYLPGEESYAIPYVHADGTHAFHPNEMDDAEAYGADDFEGFAAVESDLSLGVEMAVNEQTVSASVTLQSTAEIDGGNLRLMVAIVENTTELNVGSNGQSEFHSVFKKFVPDGNGIALSALVAGEATVHDVEYTFQGAYAEEAGYASPVDHSSEHTVEEFDDLSVIAWVQDLETWTVHNAASAGAH
jgi:hypothetical protein